MFHWGDFASLMKENLLPYIQEISLANHVSKDASLIKTLLGKTEGGLKGSSSPDLDHDLDLDCKDTCFLYLKIVI